MSPEEIEEQQRAQRARRRVTFAALTGESYPAPGVESVLPSTRVEQETVRRVGDHREQRR